MPRCVRVFLATASALTVSSGVAVFYTLPTNILSTRDGGGPRAVFNEVLPQKGHFSPKTRNRMSSWPTRSATTLPDSPAR